MAREKTEDQELTLPDEGDELDGQETEIEDAGGAEDDGGEEGSEGVDGDADSGEEAEGADEVEGQPRRAKKLGRGERRIETLRKAVESERTKREAAERRFNDELARMREERANPRVSPEEEAVRERELLAVMTPEEKMNYTLEKATRSNQQAMRQMQMQHQDAIDKATYQGKASVDPRYRKYEAEVEEGVNRLRSQGQFVTRDAYLKYLLGEKLLAQPAADRKGQKDAAKKRVAAQKGTALNGRGDASADRGRNQSLYKRLENERI